MVHKLSLNNRGMMLIEVMTVIGIMGILSTIGYGNYLQYLKRARAVHCLANRYHAEQEYIATEINNYSQIFSKENLNNLLEKDFPVFYRVDQFLRNFKSVAYASLDKYHCPEGGLYLESPDPNDPERIRIICSIHGGLASSPDKDDSESSSVLYESDFDNIDNTSPLSGKWNVQDGNLVPDEKSGMEHRIIFGDNEWKDYELTTNITLYSGSGYGIYYRGDGEKKITSYVFQYDPGYGKGAFLVRKVTDGKEGGPFQRTWIPEEFPVYNHTHEVKIKVVGDQHEICIDGHLFFSFTDDTFSQGSVGFRTWNKSQAAFNNVAVYTAESL